MIGELDERDAEENIVSEMKLDLFKCLQHGGAYFQRLYPAN